jgi:hypothetical protein
MVEERMIGPSCDLVHATSRARTGRGEGIFFRKSGGQMAHRRIVVVGASAGGVLA